LDEVTAIARKAKEAGPPCSECRYKSLLGMCGNPAYTVHEFSPATGEYSEQSRTPVADARAETGLCGPEALLYEPHGFIVPLIRGTWRGVKITHAAAVFGIILFFLLWR
jgi:hypothetical protein